jgi:hypothetical protein
MHLDFVDYREELTAAVAAFNRRLVDGGQSLLFPALPVPEWLPRRPGRKIFQEYYVAADAEGRVRGGYMLKHQEFRIGQEVLSIGDFQLPISEGVVNRAYAALGAALLRSAEQRQPLLYCLGMGALTESLPRLLAASGWRVASVPFFFRIVHPFPFLRNSVYLRRNAVMRSLLDVLAWSGLGWAAVKLIYAVLAPAAAPSPATTAELVDEFTAWTDELWDACKDHYGMCAVRNAETLRVLYPRDDARFVRLRIRRGDRTIGWTVLLNNRWYNHRHFGRMRLGSIADCLSAPADATEVIRCATQFLERRSVDLIVSNQSHAAWCKALRSSGFLSGPSNFNFASSQPLSQLLDSAGVGLGDMHWNRGDGDGPINL